MATYQLSMRLGLGSFFKEGTELTYDSTPVRVDILVGGLIDFSERPASESGLLKDNSTAGAQDPGDRSEAVIYGLAAT